MRRYLVVTNQRKIPIEIPAGTVHPWEYMVRHTLDQLGENEHVVTIWLNVRIDKRLRRAGMVDTP